MKIQNDFAIGTIQKDWDSRYVKNGTLTDAQNVLVTVSNGADQGVAKNILGNRKATNLNIAGGKTIGVGRCDTKNKVYYFVKGTSFDYIIEWDCVTEDAVVVLQSTTGGALNFIEGERILNVDVIIDPEANGDLLSFSGDTNPPRILNIERAKTWGVDGFTAEEIMLIKAPPAYPLGLEPTNSIENDESDNLKDRFLSFSYQWRYKDGYYSAFAPWTKHFFTPGQFNINFYSFENEGMQNINNAVDLTFDTGDREVDAIRLVFRLSNTSVPYEIDLFVKEDEGWSDNTSQTIQFNNSKVYKAMPESQYFRSYDNVPIYERAAALAGNRIFKANYVENYDLIDKNGDKCLMDYTVDYVSNVVTNQIVPSEAVAATYEYSGSPVIVTDGKELVNFDGFEFIQGSALYITFGLESTEYEISFNQLFTYILEADYTDVEDFITNSEFVATLEGAFTDFFEDNGGVSLPDDAIGYTLEQGFSAAYVIGDIIELTFPVVKYEIDVEPDPNTFVWDYFFSQNTIVNLQNVAVATSMKSLRSYEVCLIYKDAQGRKTTALTSMNNTVFIPNEKSVNQNVLKVTIPTEQLPPVWATTYKFGVKQNKGIYQEIIASIYFEENEFRWVKLDGVNKGKVADGDVLVVKKDSRGVISEVVKVKVLELVNQPNNFLTINDTEDPETTITEPAGLYMKIKPENFDIDYTEDEFQRYTDTENDTFTQSINLGDLWRDGAPLPLLQGSIVTLTVSFVGIGSTGTSDYNQQFIVQEDYASFEDWFNDNVDTPLAGSEGDFETEFVTDGGGRYLRIFKPDAGRMTGTLEIRSIDGFFIFETYPKDIDSNDALFFECPEVYTITDGEHEMVDHLLTDTFNCYTFGNGAESYQVLDSPTEKYLSIDYLPTATTDDEYRQINRYADITYSGVYDPNTNVNKLNEFNLSLANFKDDIEKRYGAIRKMRGKDTDLEIYQEDRVSIVYYGKDFLFNTDGSTNLQKSPEVLGQQNTYQGEYGICTFPDSFDWFGINSYYADPKRGVIMKKSNNGNFPISEQGMRNYFKSFFRDNTINQINCKYDPHYDLAIFNFQYNDDQYVTWVYSDKDNGWLTTETFNPEDMIYINGRLVSFKDGEVYVHNEGLFNTFYGVESPSNFTFSLSQEPSMKKKFKTMFSESTHPWDMTLATEMDSGYLNAVDQVKEEGVFRGYCRLSNQTLDTSLLSVQGIGQATINSLVLEFDFDLESFVSVGDLILNQTKQEVGAILSKTQRTLTLDTVNNLSSGDFVMCAKPQSIENNGLLGDTMSVTMQISRNTETTVFSVGCDVHKSYE